MWVCEWEQAKKHRDQNTEMTGLEFITCSGRSYTEIWPAAVVACTKLVETLGPTYKYFKHCDGSHQVIINNSEEDQDEET